MGSLRLNFCANLDTVLLGSDGAVFVSVGLAVENSYFIAGPAEQESGADWRAAELHPLKSSAFHGALAW